MREVRQRLERSYRMFIVDIRQRHAIETFIVAITCRHPIETFDASDRDMRQMPTGWPRPIECHDFIAHFPEKSPIISDSFAKKDLRLKTSVSGTRTIGYLCTDTMFVHMYHKYRICRYGEEKRRCFVRYWLRCQMLRCQMFRCQFLPVFRLEQTIDACLT